MLQNFFRSVHLHRIARIHFSTGVSNAHRIAYGKIPREKFIRPYYITLMQPDGSTIEVRYREPMSFIQLPVDIKSLSDHERRLRIASRKKKVVQVTEEVYEGDYDFSKYASG